MVAARRRVTLSARPWTFNESLLMADLLERPLYRPQSRRLCRARQSAFPQFSRILPPISSVWKGQNPAAMPGSERKN